MKINVVTVALFCTLSLLAACSGMQSQTQPDPENATMPNPASVFCEEQGGTPEIRADEEGGQVGICVFANGSECDEWAFYRGECTPDGPAAGPIETPENVYHPDAAAVESFDYEGWLSYTNTGSCNFTVRYPMTWVLEETTDPADTMAGHRINLRIPAEPAVVLFIAFRSADEDRQITPTGIGAGDLVPRGTIPFVGEPLSRQALVLNGKDIDILYGDGGEIVRGDHVFWISLHYAGDPVTDPGLSEDDEALADQIVASLQLTP